MRNNILPILLLVLFIFTPYTQGQKYQMRGAWIATVGNIDWPSSRTSSSGEKITELITILDNLQRAGINTIFFQVRTECDALYKSDIEPWSYWLTGKQGQAPHPYFDPLEFVIDESHKRGMELHAWFNPYRAVKTPGEYPQASNHVSVLHPDWLLQFPGYTMLNPGHPKVKEYILSVVTDVVTRYDVDGIHFDDYFYPYSPKVSNEDSLTYSLFPEEIDNIDDWRRHSINSLMASLNNMIKTVKQHIKFGISPFGIVENKFANTSGFESFHILYCDPLQWIENKSVDYVLPQLYWETDHAKASYSNLLPWWSEVTEDVHLYIGLFTSKFTGRRYEGDKTQLYQQIVMNRQFNNVLGEVHFSAKSISENFSGVADSLRLVYYRYPAFPPLMPWKDALPPNAPDSLKVEKKDTNLIISWSTPLPAKDGGLPERYIVYIVPDANAVSANTGKFIRFNVSQATKKVRISLSEIPSGGSVVVTAMDRLWNESNPSIIKIE